MKNLNLAILCCLLFAALPATAQRIASDSVYYNGKLISKAEYDKEQKRKAYKNFHTYMMPGVSYLIYTPKRADSLGSYTGINIDYLISARVSQNTNPGPSHVRFYGKLSILGSSKSEMPSILNYGLGLNLSVEKYPNRRFFIPYFGLESGGMAQRGYGNTLQFTPLLGMHIVAQSNLFVNIHAGYVYPIKNFDQYQGWTAQAGFNFALW
ncbi:MAG: hypothetical protein EP332_10655 [Bacteroidetes bacterium]|nr:MAG: hypothetical protein EP332_10655 [Bacteroidota bacterium]